MYAYQLGGVCVSIRGCTRINWGVYVYQLGGVHISIRGVYAYQLGGVYVYQLGGVRVSFRGCMIIVDLNLIRYLLNIPHHRLTLKPPAIIL